MSELIDEVMRWPIIFQGALGSGLFWIVLLIGQKAVDKVSSTYSHKSIAARKSWLVSEQFRHALGCSNLSHDEKAHFFSVLIYRSARHLYRSLMWFVLGFIANSFLNPLGVVGFVGSLFYLFKAYEIVSPNMNGPEESEKRLFEITEELKDLESTSE